MNKYKFGNKFSPVVSKYLQQKNTFNSDLIFCRGNKQKDRLQSAMQKRMQEFLEINENSSMAIGKRIKYRKTRKL